MRKSQTQLIAEIRKDPSDKVKVAVTDIDGILRGKVLLRDKFLSILDSGFGFCNVVFGWDSSDACYDNTDYTGWHSGYPDALAAVDLATFRRVPWDNGIPFFLADFRNDRNGPLEVCPRALLKKVRAEAGRMGFVPFFSEEFEWFNFRETPQELHARDFRDPRPITPGMFGYSLLRASKNGAFFNDLFDLLGKFRVPLEGLHTETGPGVYEAAILYDEVLEAADRATLFKAGVKEIAHAHGIVPSFMAKWHQDLPGCGGHFHQSLRDTGKKRNLFHDPGRDDRMSDLMKSYLAGLLHCLPDLLPIYAPTVNSYKRLVEGAWAPTTPTWGIDNRTTAIRVLLPPRTGKAGCFGSRRGENPDSPPRTPNRVNIFADRKDVAAGDSTAAKSTRLEFRVSGADANPYLVMAANLASGLYGIRNKMKLKDPPTKGSGYRDTSRGRLATNLREATQSMKRSELARELFGETFVRHFVQTREWEWRQCEKAVTDWELKRYFEII